MLRSLTHSLPSNVGDAVKIREDFCIAASINEAWSFVTDPHRVGPCIPGCEAVEVLSDTSYRGRIAVAVGPISAKFNLVVDVIEFNPPHRVVSTTHGEEGSRASIVSTKNELRLTDLGDGTVRVEAEADVMVTGRLGKFGLPIMKKKASQIAGQFARAMQEQLRTNTVGVS